MKNLYLIRHAKSSWDHKGLDDFDRPLNNRGKKDAPFMAKIFREKEFAAELFISSPAKRAYQTAKIFSRELNHPKQAIMLEETLYEASKEEILNVIKQQNDNVNAIMLFAHNPGLTDLSNYLCDFYIDNIPTTGVVALELQTNSWKNISKKSCKLFEFDYPKKYNRE
jgi:phosphohistidine phosphatase